MPNRWRMRQPGRWGSAALALVLALAAPHAARDAMAGGSDRRLAAWTKTVASGRTVKERLAAVTALAGSSDRRALAPLLTALGDPSALVRALAASAVGKVGATSALSALRLTAEDSEPTVRTKAREAYAKICKAHGMVDDLAAATAKTAAAAGAPAATAKPPTSTTSGKAGFGSAPRAVAARPTLYVVLKSSTDDSAGKYDARMRKLHADHVLASMAGAMRADATVTATASVASKYSLSPMQLDLSVTKLEHRTVGANVEIEAQLRLSIADDGGRMKAFVSGGAIVNVPTRLFETSKLPGLRREALEGAVAGVLPKLLAQLRRGAAS